MKKVLFVVLTVATFMSCEKGQNLPAPYFTVEGKWIWSPSENRADANTMFEFEDGNVYTSYCITSDRIPGADTYTFDGDTLVWKGTPRGITFECDGGKLFSNGEFSHLWRLSSSCQ